MLKCVNENKEYIHYKKEIMIASYCLKTSCKAVA